MLNQWIGLAERLGLNILRRGRYGATLAAKVGARPSVLLALRATKSGTTIVRFGCNESGRLVRFEIAQRLLVPAERDVARWIVNLAVAAWLGPRTERWPQEARALRRTIATVVARAFVLRRRRTRTG